MNAGSLALKVIEESMKKSNTNLYSEVKRFVDAVTPEVLEKLGSEHRHIDKENKKR
jgi:hypothetical protein